MKAGSRFGILLQVTSLVDYDYFVLTTHISLRYPCGKGWENPLRYLSLLEIVVVGNLGRRISKIST